MHHAELGDLAKRFDEAAHGVASEEITNALNTIVQAVDDVHRSFCGSWLGYSVANF